MKSLVLRAAAVVLIAALAGCRGSTPDLVNAQPGPTAVDSPSETPTTPTPTPTTTPKVKAEAKVTKLLVFVVENHSFDQMRGHMPFTYGLAQKFGYATDFTAIRHPSLPNYISMASGTTHGITDDQEPRGHPIDSPSVFGRAMAAGKTAGAYAEGMTGNCALSNGGDRYVARHNPWTYFTSERQACMKYDLPFTQFDAAVAGGNLPNIGFAIPNNCHNAHDHDCSLADADNWLKTQMTKIFAGPDWKSGKLAVVLTADEDDKKSDNKVLTAVIHPSQKARVVTSPLSLYSLSGLFSEVTGTTPLANAVTAPSMAKAFGLPIA